MRLIEGFLAITAVLALLGCGGGPLGDPQPMAVAAIAGDRIAGADGTELALSTWRAGGAPRAIILALHGFGDFGPSTFDGAARYWAGQGITTYAYDQRGFGRNASWQQWPGPDILISDAIAVAGALRARHPGVPLIVVGHSMGGGVTLAAAARGLPADGIVLAAPAIAGGGELGPLYRLGGWSVGTFLPDRRFSGRSLVDFRLTDNRPVLRRVTAHPRHFGDPSGRELLGLLRVVDRAAAAAPEVTIPTLTLMGARDDLVKPAQVRRVAARIPGAVGYRLYPQGYHWLFRDLSAEAVWRDVSRFARALE